MHQIEQSAKAGERASIAKSVISEVRAGAGPLPLCAFAPQRPVAAATGPTHNTSPPALQVIKLVKSGEAPTNPMLTDVAKELVRRDVPRKRPHPSHA